MRAPCPCGNPKLYMTCCRPYIAGKAQAETAQTLMRSRYTAFVKQKPAYLLATMRGAAAELHGERDLIDTRVQWCGLVIHHIVDGGVADNDGEVVFSAYFTTDGCAQKREMREHSLFKRIDGRWFYVDSVPQDELHP